MILLVSLLNTQIFIEEGGFVGSGGMGGFVEYHRCFRSMTLLFHMVVIIVVVVVGVRGRKMFVVMIEE